MQQKLTGTEQQAADLQQQLAERDMQLMELKQEAQGMPGLSKAVDPAAEEVQLLKGLITDLKTQLEFVSSQVQQQQQQQSGEGVRAEAMAAVQAEADRTRALAAELQAQVQGLNSQLSAARAAAEDKAVELRFLQRQFEQVTEELSQQKQQVRPAVQPVQPVPSWQLAALVMHNNLKADTHPPASCTILLQWLRLTAACAVELLSVLGVAAMALGLAACLLVGCV